MILAGMVAEFALTMEESGSLSLGADRGPTHGSNAARRIGLSRILERSHGSRSSGQDIPGAVSGVSL